MKAFVTGGTGFIGSRVVRRLRERGDEVVALVRSPDKATELSELGCELVEGDLSSEQAIRDGVRGCDAVFHIAAVYKVGIPASEREAMRDANVGGTERVLDAAIEAGVQRIVYVSTVGVFGNTHGDVVDETYRHNGQNFLSCYDETKWQSHQVALDRIGKGAPIVIVQPGGVYGPGDHSELGNIIDQAATGKLQHDDVPGDGLQPRSRRRRRGRHRARSTTRARPGESYVLGGQIAKMRELVEKVSEIAGRKAPKRELPVGAMKLLDPDRPARGQGAGLPAEPARADRHLGRRDVLGEGRQGAP